MIKYKDAYDIVKKENYVLFCTVYDDRWVFNCREIATGNERKLAISREGRMMDENTLESIRQGGWLNRFSLLDDRMPQISFNEACKVALAYKPNLDSCVEYENGWVFTASTCPEMIGGEGTPLVVLRDGRTTIMPEFVVLGTGKELRERKVIKK